MKILEKRVFSGFWSFEVDEFGGRRKVYIKEVNASVWINLVCGDTLSD